MPDLVERRYRPSDMPALRALWATYHGPESVTRREAAFRWVTERNPLCPDGTPRHMVMEGDRAAGTLGSLPVRFRVGDEAFNLHFSHDLLVDSSYRGLGLGKMLVRQVADLAPSMAGGLWMTGPCFALHKRMGWRATLPFHGHGIVLDAAGVLTRRIRSPLGVALTSWVARGYFGYVRRRLRSATLPVTEIERFDEGVDHLFERSVKDLGIVAERSAAYLNWKYVESPNVRYGRHLIGEVGSPSAWVVTRVDRRDDGHINGTIIDLLADPEDPRAFDSAVAAGVESCRSRGAEIVYLLTTRPALRRRIEAVGFRQATHEQNFVITGSANLPADLDPLDPASWYLTSGDSDGGMWVGAG